MKTSLFLLLTLVCHPSFGETCTCPADGLTADPPQHCVVFCTSEDKLYTYCAQPGCCGFTHVAVTAPSGDFSENGTGKISNTSIEVTTPKTKIDATAAADAYHGTLTVTPADTTQAATVTVSCPLPTPAEQ